MKNVSEVTGKTYTVEDTVRIFNPKQAATYMAHGAMPIDIMSTDCQPDKALPPDYRIEYIFKKDEKTRELFRLWCEHKLGRPEDMNKTTTEENKEN